MMGDSEPVVDNQHLPPRCHYRGRRVWRWQKHGGWGPIGFEPREADMVWHDQCLEKWVEVEREGHRVEHHLD